MPTYKLDIDTFFRAPKLPPEGYLHQLVFDVNEAATWWADPMEVLGLRVKCENKPNDSVIFGVKWLEVEIEEEDDEVRNNNN